MCDEVEANGTGQAALQVRLFGLPQVMVNRAPVAGLTSVKAQALLFYLAATRRMQARSALAVLLWGDMPEAAARGNLRKALQQLRECLGCFLRIERDAVGLVHGSGCWVDVAEFSDLLGSAAPAEAPLDLQRAVDLYRGDFLEGFHVRTSPDFERWWLSEQERLREMMLGSLQLLSDGCAAVGDLGGAIALVRRILRIEPWRESAHQNLIRLLAHDGQRGSALAQYEICRRALLEELGAGPSEETQELYRSVLTGHLGPPVPFPVHQPEIVARTPAFLHAESAAAAAEPFVGREMQLQWLEEHLKVSLAGRGRVVFVSAEAGWGKTSLLAHFSRSVQERYPGLIVASGTCTTYAGTGDPYLPFREILRMLSGDVEGKWQAGAVTRGHAVRLWDLLPVSVDALAEHGTNLLDTFVPSAGLLERAAAHDRVSQKSVRNLQDVLTHSQNAGIDQGRIFEEYGEVLAEISRSTPLLLIVDDLHWADASSINLLFHLGRRLVNSAVLILAAYRPEEVLWDAERKEHPLQGVLQEFSRLFEDIRLDLGQDDGPEENRRFVDALLDAEPNRLSEDFRARLARSTRGHPLFATELLREMRRRGDIQRDEAGRWVESPAISWDAIPGRVEGVIAKRIGRLEPGLRELLITASVEGEEFTAEAIAQVRRLDAGAVIRMLSADLGRRHHLVRGSGVEQREGKRFSRYQFSHILFQRYLYGTLDPVERVYQHEAIANALEELHGGRAGEYAAHLARHFQAAGALGKAIDYLVQAGEAAAGVYANTEAIIRYAEAIRLSEQAGTSGEQLVLLHTRLGRLLELESSFDRALETYEDLARLAVLRGDRAMELSSLLPRVAIMSVPTAVHDPASARELGELALALAQELGMPAAEARILWSLSVASFFSHLLPEAIDYGERSLALARHHGLREQVAQTLNDLGSFIYLYSGRIPQAREALHEASGLWRDLGNAPMLADSLGGSCIAHVYAGDFDRAFALSEEAFEVSRSTRNLWGQSYSRWAIGDAFAERGEFSRAIAAMQECIGLGERAGFLASQTYTRVRLALVHMELGSLDTAMQLVQEALAFSRDHIPAHMAQVLGTLARLQIRLGDATGAAATIREGRDDPHRESWPVFYLPVLFAGAELALHQGRAASALVVTGDLIGRLRRYGMASHLPEALYLQGRALLGLGQDASARDRFLEARGAAAVVGSRRTSWRILLALGQLEPDPAEAESLYRQARSVQEFILAHLDAAHAGLRETFLSQARCATRL